MRRSVSTIKSLLAAGGLFLSTGAAFAVPTSCGAVSLLDALRKEAPEIHQRVMSAAASVKNGDGMLWRVEKPGVRPSYLFGTMHSTDPRLNGQVQRVLPRVRNATNVAVEVSELVTPGARDKASQRVAMAAVATRGNILEALDPPANRRLVEQALAARGVSPAVAERFEGWFLITLMSSPACERQRRQMGLSSVDEKIGAAGAAARRPVVGLEKLEDQIAVLRRIGGWDPPGLLIQTVRSAPALANMRETLTRAYIGDRLGELMALSRISEIAQGIPVDQETSAFTRSLLDDRNYVMRDGAIPLIDKGNAVIAVGALHLPGSNGLVQLLRDKGYAVSVIKGR